MTRDDLPTPGPNPPVPAWEEYDQLREAVEDYLDHQPDDPIWNDIWRALGAIMGEYQRDAFLEAFDVDERAEESPYNQWFDLFEFASTWGMEVSVLPKSWYNLGSTVQVVVYPPERYR